MMMEEAPPPGAAAFQSVEECVQALPAILDGGGAARTDAYAFLYSRLEVRSSVLVCVYGCAA